MRKKFQILLIILLLTGCKPKTYTVTFYQDDGTKLSSITVNKGENIKAYGYPEKEGYLFVSWLKDGSKFNENNEIYSDVELTASYTEIPEVTKTYIVTYDFGDEIKTESVKENELASKPTNPSKNKYKFLGWYKENELYDFNTKITENITLVAKYEKSRVTIKLDLDGGTGTIETEINKGETLKIKPPEKYGFNFVSWSLNDEYFDINTKIEDDITLKAIYEPKNYVRVKFDTDGGTNILSKIIEEGTILDNVNTPEKKGYIFKYWSLNDEYFDIKEPINDNITLKAIYEENN